MNERIKKALDSIGLPVKPDRYKGDEESYIVFNYSTLGACYADDAPGFERYLVQVHFFCPAGVNSPSFGGLSGKTARGGFLLAGGGKTPRTG